MEKRGEGLGVEVLKKVRQIKLLLLDVDGVLTDGSIILGSEGVELKAFNVRDGHGIKLLKRGGVDCGIITSRSSNVVDKRARELGIELVYQGALDKVAALDDILLKNGLEAEEVAFIGDDLVDLPVLRRVGFSVAVGDAASEVKERVDYVTKAPGGRGAVREISEVLLRVKGRWEELLARYTGG